MIIFLKFEQDFPISKWFKDYEIKETFCKTKLKQS